MLCQGGQYDSFNGSQFDSSQANKFNGKNNGLMHPIIGLPLGPLGHKGPISCIGNDIKHSLQCVVSLGKKSFSQACGHFFMGWMPKEGVPICLNGAFHGSTTILCFVIASTAEAELGILYRNCQTGIIFLLTLANMGNSQPKKTVHCNNATAVGIVNNTIKHQHSKSMDMRFFWIGDKVAREMNALK
jgi:hypothetical protein